MSRPHASPRANARAGWLILAALGAVLAASVFIYLFCMRAASPPSAIVLSVCQAVAPGIQRIKGDFGVRFDVPDAKFSIKDGARDMPPGTLYKVALKDRAANMMVWHDDDVFSELKSAFPVFSRHVGEGEVRTLEGRKVGRDRWGDLRGGDRWRYVTFSSGDAVGYWPIPPNEARLFDQVLDSACLSSN